MFGLFASKVRASGLLFVVVPIIPKSAIAERLWYLVLGANTYHTADHICVFTVRIVEYLVERAGYELNESNVIFAWFGEANDIFNYFLKESWGRITVVARKRNDFQLSAKSLEELSKGQLRYKVGQIEEIRK